MPAVPSYQMKGVQQLEKSISRRLAKITGPTKSNVTDVQVSYDAYYAIYVHENLQAHHDNGEAKFLTRAFAAKKVEGIAKVASMLKNGRTIGQALYTFGLIVQYESQRRVPVKSGALKASAKTRLIRRN